MTRTHALCPLRQLPLAPTAPGQTTEPNTHRKKNKPTFVDVTCTPLSLLSQIATKPQNYKDRSRVGQNDLAYQSEHNNNKRFHTNHAHASQKAWAAIQTHAALCPLQLLPPAPMAPARATQPKANTSLRRFLTSLHTAAKEQNVSKIQVKLHFLHHSQNLQQKPQKWK